MQNPDDFLPGCWPSPISAASVAEGALRFGRLQMDAGRVFWSEGRPLEGGRTAIMSWSGKDGLSEVLPKPFSARSRVHEYGGGEFLVAGGTLFFVNDGDQDVYEMALDGAQSPFRLTEEPHIRFADCALDGCRNRLIAVAERHSPASGHETLPRNFLCAIQRPAAPSAGERVSVLFEGRDFYASPATDAGGTRLAFLTWDLPYMPWDAASLYVAGLDADGKAGAPIQIAGGDGTACFQPEWGPDGALYFVWDKDGLGNLYRWAGNGPTVQITKMDAEISKPMWNFGPRSFQFLPNNKIFFTYVAQGEQGCAVLDLSSGEAAIQRNALTAIQTISGVRGKMAFAALTDREPQSIFVQDVDARGLEASSAVPPFIVRKSSQLEIDSGFIAEPERVEIRGSDDERIFGLLYQPMNPAVPKGREAPPLVINLHGGPTSATSRGLKPRTLYFTSRGFAWLDLDYSGSVGYGRDYRERLQGNWGVRDVDDTIEAAKFAASRGIANPNAIFVTGGSAGGYTVLMAIARSNLFRGAASYYGICDLVALQHTTHKFEQGYQTGLLGASLVEDEARYRERSAISHIGNIETPLIVFQGTEDRVVPKEQAKLIAEALQRRSVPVHYHEFEGEGHGFRRSETIQKTLELELAFYQNLLTAG